MQRLLQVYSSEYNCELFRVWLLVVCCNLSLHYLSSSIFTFHLLLIADSMFSVTSQYKHQYDSRRNVLQASSEYCCFNNIAVDVVRYSLTHFDMLKTKCAHL